MPPGTEKALAGPPLRVKQGLAGGAVIVDRGICLPWDWV